VCVLKKEMEAERRGRRKREWGGGDDGFILFEVDKITVLGAS